MRFLKEDELDAAFKLILEEGKSASEATRTAKLQSRDFQIKGVATLLAVGIPLVMYLKGR